MLVHFSKYHGTGNDFVMIDGRKQDTAFLNNDLIRRLCDRRFGIGGDGLIILEDSTDFDFRMRYYNADGREGTMCGNGGRCITSFAYKIGACDENCTFEGIDGKHEASILKNGEIRLRLKDVHGIETMEDGYLLDTGSPHFIKFVPDIEKTDVEHDGAGIRNQARFGPGGVNANFVELGPLDDQISVRTFERGVEAETWSCGTGVSAAAIAASLHTGSDNLTYRVLTRGGDLRVSFSVKPFQHYTGIYLTGPASHVYDGTIEIVI